ncbi:clarin-2-like [Acropora millepora]|uniref:clarin-2-like n=1 Tax=Acropora millepora TaxID=45264 RepID=UPI0010FCB3D9|nr:clarin-2-like [Acropora millepora]
MTRIFKRRGTAVVAAVFAFISFVMIIAALLSDYWVVADLKREIGNSTRKGGSKHFGMFNGESKENFGLGERQRDFAVKDEFDGITNDDVLWATVGFCILSLVALCALIGLSCFNEFAEPDLTIFGSAGMFICCGTAFLFVLVSICSFAALFEIQLKKNVVRPLDQKRGFSSTDNAHLGYSFWILLGAAGVLLLCPLMIMMKNCRCLHYFKKKKHEITTVDGVMLY